MSIFKICSWGKTIVFEWLNISALEICDIMKNGSCDLDTVEIYDYDLFLGELLIV